MIPPWAKLGETVVLASSKGRLGNLAFCLIHYLAVPVSGDDPNDSAVWGRGVIHDYGLAVLQGNVW